MEVQPPQPEHLQQQEHQPQPNAYHVDIPALLPPQQQVQMAPAIVQGTPLDQNNTELARSDVDSFESMRRRGQATQEQVSVAQQRYFNVQLCHAPGMANLGVGIVAAIQNMQNAMDQRFTNMQNAINQRFTNMQNTINQRFNSMDARFENVGRRAKNLESTSRIDANAPLMPLLKERPGLGPVLPGNFEPIIIDDLLVQVGDPVQQRFPPNVDEMSLLSHADINFLSQMYNNSFRIVGGDTIAARRRKFKDFIVQG